MRRFNTNILSELKGKQRELSSLKEDVRENCLSVSSDVKKTPGNSERLVWKYEGNKIQYRRYSETNSLGFG